MGGKAGLILLISEDVHQDLCDNIAITQRVVVAGHNNEWKIQLVCNLNELLVYIFHVVVHIVKNDGRLAHRMEPANGLALRVHIIFD